jgi:hypothetical protein
LEGELKITLESEILAIYERTAVIAIRLDGKYGEQLIFIDLNELEDLD